MVADDYVIQPAADADVEAMAALINAAFDLEKFFVVGNRINADDVRRLMASGGTFFVMKDGPEPLAVVYAEPRPPDRGYIGLLAVKPGVQGRSVGSRLMQHAEAHLRAGGATAIVITVVDLRTELFPFYEKRGYRRVGTEPFPRATHKPCQLIVMVKQL